MIKPFLNLRLYVLVTMHRLQDTTTRESVTWIKQLSTRVLRAYFVQPAVADPLNIYEKRESYTSGHFIWNLWNEPSASFNNFIWNDQECKILFIIWPFKIKFYRLQNGQYFKKKSPCWLGPCQWRYVCAPVLLHVWSYDFMTRHYPLNNSDVMW